MTPNQLLVFGGSGFFLILFVGWIARVNAELATLKKRYHSLQLQLDRLEDRVR